MDEEIVLPGVPGDVYSMDHTEYDPLTRLTFVDYVNRGYDAGHAPLCHRSPRPDPCDRDCRNNYRGNGEWDVDK